MKRYTDIPTTARPAAIEALFAKLDKIDAKLDLKANRADCPVINHQ